jgi:hypothetical protein
MKADQSDERNEQREHPKVFRADAVRIADGGLCRAHHGIA